MPRRLTKADNGKLIFVPTDGSVLIELASNPTTGFTWVMDGTAAGQEGVNVTIRGNINTYITKYFHIRREYIHPDKGRLGASGTDRFRVTPRVSGEHELVLVYARSWEAPEPEAERFRVRLRAGERIARRW
ncbi:cysteine peptidase inhibitor [Trypanosoma theileri]|uniref:Cysteine peptidase inhibitor n=1 Tax=Trypanosoma theileri TaxID=67003 RepID=A0A1X0NXG1_9TRYP|nr:cysteine peptidase inhibitor [Trypanosoma theileri]ORC88820.1 cysteine peptidase inhibitor [Trypanosoma theileri]